MLVAIPAALVAGACFAIAGLLQQRVASTRPRGRSFSVRILRDLVRQRLWITGMGFAVLAYGFQGLALAYGPLILVQPLIVTELIFAVPLAARMHHLRLGWRSWIGAAAVGGGLAIAIFAAAPSGELPSAPPGQWLLLLCAVTGLVIMSVIIGLRVSGPPRASLFALAGATVMGAQSGLYAATITNLRDGLMVALAAWQSYILVVASIAGLLLIQNAFRAGPLAASMPVVDTVELVVAVAIGVVLFDERIAGSAVRQATAAVALVVVIVGIVVLDTSPVTRRLHRRESHERERIQDESAQVGLEEP